MKLSWEDKNHFENSICCSIYNESFEDGDIKCRDHDHRTGNYRGAAHQKCSVNCFNNRYILIVFHNLRGYDGNCITK